MSDTEARLRAALHAVTVTEPDPEALAAAARSRAARNRRRVVSGALVAVVVVGGLGAVLGLGRDDRAAPSPAHPTPTSPGRVPDAEACGVRDLTSLVPQDEPLSQGYRRAALCPADPDDPAWSELPDPAVIHGGALDGLAVGGGPPVETCDGSDPGIPDFTLVVEADGGPWSAVEGHGQTCSGAQLAQSFVAMLALEEDEGPVALRYACDGLPLDSDESPAVDLPNVESVHLCLYDDPYTEALPAPLHYRSVRRTTLAGSARRAVVQGLSTAHRTDGAFVDCPWRRAAAIVTVRAAGGAHRTILLRCEQDYERSDSARLDEMAGYWTQLGPAGQAYLAAEVTDYLGPAAPSGIRP